MPTNIQVKQQIDTEITNKTNPLSVTPIHVGTNMKNLVDYVDQQVATIPIGPQGPAGIQGEQGLQGVPGAVGPAGLEWQGLWNPDNNYAVDDAVGYLGSSYFCYAPVLTTGNIPPSEDTTRWALLASRGVDGTQGPIGVTGIQGPQGLPGESGVIIYEEGSVNATNNANAISPLSSEGKIVKDFTRVYIPGTDPLYNNYVGISGTDLILGQTFIIENKSTEINLKIRFFNGAKYLFTSFTVDNELVLPPNRILKFTVCSASTEKVLVVEDISPRNEYLKIQSKIPVPSNSGDPTNFLSLDYLEVSASDDYSNGINFKGTLNLGESFILKNVGAYGINFTATESGQNIEGNSSFTLLPYTTYQIIKDTNSTNSLSVYVLDKYKRKSSINPNLTILNATALNSLYADLTLYDLNFKMYYTNAGVVQERISVGVWITYNITIVT